MDESGLVLKVLRMSTEDGPGVRTTVFLKGCPLNCLWCHNPESIGPRIDLQWFRSKCIGCQGCMRACPENALAMTENGIEIHRALCSRCGICADQCPSGAMEMIGEIRQAHELVKELERDRVYFERSGGGVTISGGEPTFQSDFSAAVLKGLKEAGLSTAIDTCGYCSENQMGKLLPFSDLALFDLKIIDPVRHKTFTGVSNDLILKRLVQAHEHMKSHNTPRRLWIRTPIIPGITDDTENIMGIGAFIWANLKDCVERWELCAFNNYCADKYERLNLAWSLACIPTLTNRTMEDMASIAKDSGVNPEIVSWSGATRGHEEYSLEAESSTRAQ